LQLFVIKDKNIMDELLWTMNIVCKQTSFLSAEQDTKVLKAMAPNDLSKFSLDKNKVSAYVNKALGPFFKETIKKDMKNQHFALLFDETKNNKHKKELQVQVKYESQMLFKVNCLHIRTFELDKADAATIFDRLTSAMQEFDLKPKLDAIVRWAKRE
jgi:hypothetical protein